MEAMPSHPAETTWAPMIRGDLSVNARDLRAVMIDVHDALPLLGINPDIDMWAVAVHGYKSEPQLLFWIMNLGDRQDN